MKKRVIAVYALIGLLALGSTTLTSCVDDNESASVTAIREAKAAQLNALAAASNAEAKVNEALAALKQAKAEAQTIKNDYDKQRYAAKLEKLKAKYAQAIAEAQKAQADAEQSMKEDLQMHQQTLYSNYKVAQNEVTSLSNQIAEKNVEIAKLEAGLISAKAAAKAQIVGFRMDSIKAEAQKATYEAMGENNYDELVKQYEEAQIKYTNQSTEVTVKTNEQIAASEAFDKAKWAFEGGFSNGVMVEPTLETGKAIKALQDNGLGHLLVSEPQYVDPEDETTTSIDVYSLNEAEVLRKNADIDQDLINANEVLGTEEDQAAIYHNGSFVVWNDANSNNVVDNGETQPASNWSEYKYYEKAYEDAKEALENAAEADKPQYEIAVKRAEATMIDQKAVLVTDQEEVIAELEDQKAALKEATDAFAGETYKAYTDAITAVLAKEGKALDDAKAAVDAAKLAQAEIEGQRDALADLVGVGGTTINLKQMIADCEEDIANATEDIKEAELLLINPSDNATAQTVIDNAKAELEDLNEQLTLAQSLAESCYKQLEASLKGETPSGPETPEEGGETETPAE